MTTPQSSTAYAELVDRAIARVGLPELARIARDAGLIVPTPEHLRAIVDAAPVAVDAEMEDDEAGFSDLETGFERPAIIAGPVLDEHGKSWCDHYRIDPAPAAVDTGRAHGPSFSELLRASDHAVYAAFCALVFDPIVGDWTPETEAPYRDAQRRHSALCDLAPSPFAVIDERRRARVWSEAEQATVQLWQAQQSSAASIDAAAHAPEPTADESERAAAGDRVNDLLDQAAARALPPAAVDTGATHGPALADFRAGDHRQLQAIADSGDRDAFEAAADAFAARWTTAREVIRSVFLRERDGKVLVFSALLATPLCPNCHAVIEPDDTFCLTCDVALDHGRLYVA